MALHGSFADAYLMNDKGEIRKDYDFLSGLVNPVWVWESISSGMLTNKLQEMDKA